MSKRAVILLLAAVLSSLTVRAEKNDRGVASIGPDSPVFIAKGSWTVGGKISWSQHTNANYRLTLIEGINSKGYTISAMPVVMYGFSKNFAAGLRLGYKRNFLDIASAGVSIMGTTIDVKDYYSLSNNFSAELFGRVYMPLGRSGRFALFADVGVIFGIGQSKVTDRQGKNIIGTYQKNWSLSLGCNPGISTFLTDHLIMDAGIGVVGLGLENVSQVHNQVSTGSRNDVHFSYMLNILSLSVGLHYYF